MFKITGQGGGSYGFSLPFAKLVKKFLFDDLVAGLVAIEDRIVILEELDGEVRRSDFFQMSPEGAAGWHGVTVS